MVKMEESVDNTTRYKHHKMYQAQAFLWSHPLLSTRCMWNRLWYVSIHQIGQCWRCNTLLPATWKVRSCTTQVYNHPTMTRADCCNFICQCIKDNMRKIAVHMNDEIFWTDSQVAVVYITISKCFRMCKVSKSLRQIKSNNLADDNSRGLESQHQEKIKRWFEGPSLLWSKEHLWLKNAASSDTRWGSWD